MQLAADACNFKQATNQYSSLPFVSKNEFMLYFKTNTADTGTRGANFSCSLVKLSDLTLISCHSECGYAGTPFLLCVELAVDTLNTSCEAISSLFEKNYLRCNLFKKNRFSTFSCFTCFESSKNRGWSH